jgi:uncharacterized membrane protein YeiH
MTPRWSDRFDRSLPPATETLRTGARSVLTRVDLLATFVFALEGATTATYYDVDIFGVVVLGCSTALVGGIIRDVLIGCTPPASLRTPRYPVIAIGGAVLVLLLDHAVHDIPMWLLQLTDALGLALFAVVGATKALEYGINAVVAAALGAVSAVGGGLVRDTLLNIVPVVLRADVYAVAALSGASVTVALFAVKANRLTALSGGFAVCFVLRILAVTNGWNLPHTG